METNDEWIVSRTGIRERHIAAPHEATSDLAYEAALKALDSAGMKAEDLDLIIIATVTPDSAFLLQPVFCRINWVLKALRLLTCQQPALVLYTA